jgi:hypothetical protein
LVVACPIYSEGVKRWAWSLSLASEFFVMSVQKRAVNTRLEVGGDQNGKFIQRGFYSGGTQVV